MNGELVMNEEPKASIRDIYETRDIWRMISKISHTNASFPRPLSPLSGNACRTKYPYDRSRLFHACASGWYTLYRR